MVVNAIVAGLWPWDFKKRAQQVALVRHVVDDTDDLLKLLGELSNGQYELETLAAKRTSAAAGQAAVQRRGSNGGQEQPLTMQQ